MLYNLQQTIIFLEYYQYIFVYTGDVETEGEAHSSDDEETDPGSDWSEPSIPEPLEEKLKRYINCVLGLKQ